MLMARTTDPIDAEATAWAVRTGDPAFDDWEGFTAWLEADPRHAARYDAVASAAADAAAILPSAPPIPQARPNRRWMAGGLAAAMAAGLVGGIVWQNRADPYAVETAPGATRVVQLADGSAVTLGGGTRVTLDRRDPRQATLERGEAMFAVRHDAAHPFEVRAGNTRMVDLGTRFDVKHAAGLTRVAVAEGAVMYDPDGAAVRLDPGQALVDADGAVRRERIDPAAIGDWRGGARAYDGASLTEVADDLARASGMRVTVAAELESRRFHGTLDPAAAREPATLGALLGVAAVKDGDGLRLQPRR
jgi:transmembrane sensor